MQSTRNTALLIIVLVIAGMAVLKINNDRIAKNECFKLTWQAKQFENFWITESQKDHCDRYEIEINAPVAENQMEALKLSPK